MENKKDVPYYLLIHTDSYAGNFERELVAYCFGKLDEEQEGCFNEYSKSFWNNSFEYNTNSYEEALQFDKKLNKKDISFNKILNIINEADILLGNKSIENKEEKENIFSLYDKYICSTYQKVDDWEQNTFYNIESFYKNDKYNFDTILVQLNFPLSEYLENIVIDRIKNFFKEDVLDTIENYIWLCRFGCKRNVKKEKLSLLDLELVDTNYNLIKKYV